MSWTSYFFCRAKCGVMVVAVLLPLCAAVGQPGGADFARRGPGPIREYSAASLFNEANALSRGGRTGLAILDYKRASLLAPSDSAIVANLRLARAHAGLPNPPAGWWNRIFGSLPANAMAWLGSFGLIIAGSGLLLTALHRPRRPGLRVVIALGGMLVAAAVGSASATLPRLSEAVVVARNAAARVAPAAAGEVAFQLKEGETVKLDGEADGFVLVRNPAGQSGWVARGEVVRAVE